MLALSLAAASTAPAASALPCGVAATVLGYLVGTAVPAAAKKVVHPILTCALVGNLGVALHGRLAGLSYQAALKGYLTKVRVCVGWVGDGEV